MLELFSLIAFPTAEPYSSVRGGRPMSPNRTRSPHYPNFSLREAIARAERAFNADRRNPMDRDVAAKNIGYSGSSGAADKALATLNQYGLLERVGKGQVRVSQLALDILHPENPSEKSRALNKAAFTPPLFKDLRNQFPDGASEANLHSYLVRQNFQNRALRPAIGAYLETCSFLKQENAYESHGAEGATGAESDLPDDESDVVYGGARVGDLIQWESAGALQFETPRRVRAISPDGLYVAVDGYSAWAPMSEVIVEGRATLPPPPPPLEDDAETKSTLPGEAEWMRNSLGAGTKVRLLVTGDMGPREINKLIKLLEAQRAVLSDDPDLFS
jgi:hypothetical protein